MAESMHAVQWQNPWMRTYHQSLPQSGRSESVGTQAVHVHPRPPHRAQHLLPRHLQQQHMVDRPAMQPRCAHVLGVSHRLCGLATLPK
jgi:hypothetical protein